MFIVRFLYDADDSTSSVSCCFLARGLSFSPMATAHQEYHGWQHRVCSNDVNNNQIGTTTQFDFLPYGRNMPAGPPSPGLHIRGAGPSAAARLSGFALELAYGITDFARGVRRYLDRAESRAEVGKLGACVV